jgi:hypothetical protein
MRVESHLVVGNSRTFFAADFYRPLERPRQPARTWPRRIATERAGFFFEPYPGRRRRGIVRVRFVRRLGREFMRMKLAVAAFGLVCFQSAGAALAHTAVADQIRAPSALPAEKVMLAQRGIPGAGPGANSATARKNARQSNKGKNH